MSSPHRPAESPSIGSSTPLKVFFVGDNRTAVNWGRAASIALETLLAASFRVVGRVTGDQFILRFAAAGYIRTLLPSKYYGLFRHILSNRHKWRILDRYIRFEELLGARDFIREDPVETVDILIAEKYRHPALADIHKQASAADIVVLDGDGDIIFTSPPRRETLFLLAMIELGLRLGKRVFLVNSMISDCPLTGRNCKTLDAARGLLVKCSAVALRDPVSFEYVRKEMRDVNCSYIPDSLFTWFPVFQGASAKPPANGDFLIPFPEAAEYWGKLDFTKPYICIGGGALSASDPANSIRCYGLLVDAIKELGLPVYLTENDTPDSFLRVVAKAKGLGLIPATAPILMCGAVLANARIFISGRYHPSILASLGGTPCIFLGSHAHKMSSLSRVLECQGGGHFEAFPDESAVLAIVSTAKNYLSQAGSLRAKIRNVSRMRCDEASQLPDYILKNLSAANRV